MASIQIAHTVAEIQQARRDMNVRQGIAHALLKFYPGHVWAVDVRHGLADIKNLSLSGEYGFRLDVLAEDFSASALERAVMLAGGELLERYKLDRGRARQHQLAALKYDHRENAIHA